MLFISLIFSIIIRINAFFLKLKKQFFVFKKPHYHFKKNNPSLAEPAKRKSHKNKKPDWVVQDIIWLAALMPNEGYRPIEKAFNRINEHKNGMTVCKSTVGNILKKNRYQVEAQRKEIRNRKPKATPKNVTWSLDLTTITCDNIQNIVMGVIDNGSRANLLLKEITTKSSIMILKQLIAIIELYGKPKKLRMDNEANFKSRIFRFGLFLLGIKPEYTEVACPWMNGRIERFFGTLKQHICKIALTQDSLEQRLIEFRYFYNHVRTHANLNGRTPAEVWSKKNCNKRGEAYQFELWHGILSGFYLPPE